MVQLTGCHCLTPSRVYGKLQLWDYLMLSRFMALNYGFTHILPYTVNFCIYIEYKQDHVCLWNSFCRWNSTKEKETWILSKTLWTTSWRLSSLRIRSRNKTRIRMQMRFPLMSQSKRRWRWVYNTERTNDNCKQDFFCALLDAPVWAYVHEWEPVRWTQYLLLYNIKMTVDGCPN